jgi:hypothetical protein
MLDVGYWTLATAEPVHGGGGLDVSFFSESDGCLVALAVFKTVVGSQEPGQVRFLSSPPILLL